MDLKRKLFIAGAAMVPVLGVGGLAYATTSGATTPAPQSNSTSTPGTSAPQASDNSSTSETPGTSEAPGTAQADGPGGHQDAAGVNADHQFDGPE